MVEARFSRPFQYRLKRLWNKKKINAKVQCMTNVHTCMHAYMYAYIHECGNVYIHTYVRTYIRINIHIPHDCGLFFPLLTPHALPKQLSLCCDLVWPSPIPMPVVERCRSIMEHICTHTHTYKTCIYSCLIQNNTYNTYIDAVVISSSFTPSMNHIHTIW